LADQIRIRVGATVDRNVGNAFRPIVDAARVARQAVEDEMERAWAAVNGKGAVKGGGQGPYRSVVRAAETAANQIVETERRKQTRIASEEARATRRREAAERHVARIRDRYFTEQQRQGERADKLAADNAGKERRAGGGRLRAIGSGSVETLGKIGRGALGVTGSIARGAGVQTDLGAYVGQAVELETRAAELSAAAYDEKRDKGKRVDPKGLVRLGRDVGREAAFDPAKVLEGLQAFVGKTGDLATGQAALPGLAKLARATGTSLEDMVGAAGEASKSLGDVGPGKEFETAAEKGKALVNVLRLMAGQGKVGAAELKDMAKYGGRLAAASQAFGGDAAQNLGDMGALAQLAIARGGAASAAEAATSVAGFANTLKTPARVKEFKAHGVDIMDKGGGFKSARNILKDSAAASVERGGAEAPLEFKKMFANVKGAQAADPAFQAYVKAFRQNIGVTKDKTKADQAGRAAVDELFDNFGKAISATEEKESFDRSMKTGAAQVQLFNNKLGEIGGQIAEKVLPELSKAGPTIVRVVEAFAKMIAFAAENPGMAIVAAITASIGKAAIGAAVGGAVNKLIDGAGSKMSGKMAMALGTATISIAAATIIAQVMNEKKAAGAEAVKTDVVDANKAVTTAEKEFKEKGTISPENMQALENARISIAAAENAAKAYQGNGGDQRYYGDGGVAGQIAGGARQAFDVATGKTSFDDLGRGAQAQDQMRDLSLMRQSIDAMKAAIEQQARSTQKVEITNLPASAGPVANTTNTTK
jgi:hypothetical protein